MNAFNNRNLVKDCLCQNTQMKMAQSMAFIMVCGLLLIFSISNSFSQTVSNKFTVSGYVRDSLRTEVLSGATVLNKASFKGASSNQYGFFSLTLPAGVVDIEFSYVGYKPQIHNFHLRRDTTININLAEATHLQEVVISADNTHETQSSFMNVPVAQIKSMPALMGEADVLKALQMLPGIQSGNEGSSGLHVRGGGIDQNLVLLDGVPVYNANHLFGFFSVFNADAINSVEVYKGGFPARYGGRASSVVDITMKEGSLLEYNGEGALGLVGGRFTFGGPVKKERSSFIVSGRVSPLGYLTKPTMNVSYYFNDLTAKINHEISKTDRIYFSAYIGNDNFSMGSENIISWDITPSYQQVPNHTIVKKYIMKWGNITSSLRWNHVFFSKLFSNFNLTYSKYRLRTNVKHQENLFLSDPEKTEHNLSNLMNMSGIEDLACRMAFDYFPAPRHHLRFGGSSIYHIFEQGSATFDGFGSKDNISKITAFEHALYIEDDMTISRKLKINMGIRFSAFDVQNTFYQSIEPRISLSYQPIRGSAFKASYTRMSQFTQLLTNSGVGFPTDLWVPSSALLKPQQADQFAVQFERSTDNNMYQWCVEGYYKMMNHVLEYKERSSIYNVTIDWEQKVSQGMGQSYGLELFVQKKKGATTGWIGYTLARSTRKFEDINGGLSFPYKYDRRHDFNMVMNHRFNNKIEFSATWVFSSGICATLPIVYHNMYPVIAGYPGASFGSSAMIEYSKRNEYRMSPYHRLDLSISFIKPVKWGERRWIIGVYNAYARKNPYMMDLRSNGNNFYYCEISIFPILPSISYQFKF